MAHAKLGLLITGIVLAMAVMAIPETVRADHHDNMNYCDTEPLQNFWEPQIAGNILSGKGKICVTPQGVKSNLKVRGLTPGNAYTVWWGYIDRPDECIPFWLEPPDVPFPEPVGWAGACSFVDAFTIDPSGEFLNPLIVFGRMDSAIPKENGVTRFSGTIRGMKPSPGSQIHMLIFGHGPAATSDGRQLARQLLTPEDPSIGIPHLGIEGRPFGYPAAVVVVTVP